MQKINSKVVKLAKFSNKHKKKWVPGITLSTAQVVHTRASILSPNRVIFDTGKEWYKCSVAGNITAKRNGNYDRVYD